jgi:CheY-like chemotaxis protein
MTHPSALIIIGNDPMLGDIMSHTLEHVGFDAALDIGGIEYVSMLVAHHPSMIVLDLDLPEDLGLQILDDLRNLCPEWAPSIALVTSNPFHARDLKSNGEMVLTKPVSPTQLMEFAFHVKNELAGSL